jgi:phage-related minor tail protein
MALLDELLVRIGMDSSGVDEGADQVTSKLDSLAGPAAAAGALAGGVFAVGLSAAMDITTAQNKLQNQLGLTEAEAERAGGVAGDVFSAGFGESLDDVNTALGGVHSGIGDLADFTEAELESMSKTALGLSKTFEVDVAEATGAVGQLIKTGLVKDATEGFDLVTQAMQQVPAHLRDDLLPTINEYSTQFRRVGLDGQTSMGLLAQAAAAGARDLDQVADGIGQFGERALAGGTAVDDAFKSIGLSSKDMAKLIGAGGASAEKALQMTMDGLRGTENEQVKLNAAAALFGDPANVMGEALFALDPATAAAATGMDKAAGASKGLTDNMEKDPAQQMDAAMRQLSMGLGEALLPILLKVSGFMKEHKGLMTTLVPIVLGLAVALGIMAAVIWLVNIAMLANPVAWIILGIIALIAIIALIIIKWDLVKEKTLEVWDAIVSALSDAWGWITRKVSQVWNWIMGKIGGAWNWIVRNTMGSVRRVMGVIGTLSSIPGKVAGWFGKVVSFVQGLPGRIAKASSGMWDGIKDSFIGAVNFLIWKWNSLSFTIGGGSIMGVSIPSLTLHTPDIPYLAQGGITTGPTLAMIGEGREREVVLPLSKLEQMLNTPGGMRAPSVGKMQPMVTRVELDVTGGQNAFTEFFKETVRLKAGGSVVRFGEG